MAGFSSGDDIDSDKMASFMLDFNPDQVDYLQCDKKLKNFIEQLNDIISLKSGVSKQKEKQLQTVKHVYKRVKAVYFQKLIIYKEVKKILKDSQRSETIDHIRSFDVIERSLTTADLRSKEIDEKNNVLGLEDKHFNTPKVQEGDENELQQQLELVLHEIMSEFAKYYKKISETLQEDDKQQKTLMLHTIIERKKQELDDQNEYLAEITRKYQSLTVDYYKGMKESAQVLSDLTNLILSYNHDERKLIVLSVKTKTLLLKMRCFQLEVEMETYPAKTIKAHQRIRDHLKDSLAEATSKKMYAEQQLSIINSIGSEFNSLASEYGVVIEAIENKEWMLSKLKKQNED